ncbi:hypothetical protein [Spirillospora sp. CA-128828]|uniref:hypothetical protein n=1 Tax=Spirillospora sp. CA-128828 TaxID=3240033 RepID=UPI003D8ED4F8
MAMFGAPIGGGWGGLFSDLVRVPWADAMLVPLPSRLDPVAMASASDNWSLSWQLVAPHLREKPGARVLVIARGSIGLYVCDIARALGASDVLYVDPDPAHRAIAESYGASTVTAIEPIHHGFDLAIESTGRVDQLAVALQSLVPEGFCESAGNHFRPGELPLLDVPERGHAAHRPRQRAHPALTLRSHQTRGPGGDEDVDLQPAPVTGLVSHGGHEKPDELPALLQLGGLRGPLVSGTVRLDDDLDLGLRPAMCDLELGPIGVADET